MARDAIRVSNDELLDETLHEKYHEAVVAKLGKDARPTESRGLDE